MTLTTEVFIERAKVIHNDKYGYAKVKYTLGKNDVIILCKNHGEFTLRAERHLRGAGCKQCGRENTIASRAVSTEEFIEKAKLVHGDKYDYSLVDYKKTHSNVTIICNLCGSVFEQTPDNHKAGKGCIACGGRKKLTTETFIEGSVKVHGDKFDYCKVKYVSAHSKVIIICNACGCEFLQSPNKHRISKRGCPNCKLIRWRLTTSKFIKNAIENHGYKYDYSKVEYICNKASVIIICKNCGYEFSQIASSHMRGQGCPSCSPGGFKNEKPAILYYLRVKQPFNTDKFLYKIGITNLTVEERFSGIDMQSIETLKTWEFPIGHSAKFAEKLILDKFKEFRYKGEAILTKSGNTELFTKDVLGLDI